MDRTLYRLDPHWPQGLPFSDVFHTLVRWVSSVSIVLRNGPMYFFLFRALRPLRMDCGFCPTGVIGLSMDYVSVRCPAPLDDGFHPCQCITSFANGLRPFADGCHGGQVEYAAFQFITHFFHGLYPFPIDCALERWLIHPCPVACGPSRCVTLFFSG